jgi:hypothetical protein
VYAYLVWRGAEILNVIVNETEEVVIALSADLTRISEVFADSVIKLMREASDNVIEVSWGAKVIALVYMAVKVLQAALPVFDKFRLCAQQKFGSRDHRLPSPNAHEAYRDGTGRASSGGYVPCRPLPKEKVLLQTKLQFYSRWWRRKRSSS